MIRKFKKSDLPEILEIEKKSFKDPWSKLEFKLWSWRHPNFLVYEIENQVVGYVIFNSQGHIANIAVNPNYRRRGVGTKLIKEALKKLKEARVEVRESNKAAQKFYQSLGFKEKNRIIKYYGDEDALIMAFATDRKEGDKFLK